MLLFIREPESVLRLAFQIFGVSNYFDFNSHLYSYSIQFLNVLCNFIYFSGPKGVWTLEKEGKAPQVNVSFSEAIPTKCHMALKALIDTGHIKYIISQNIDGLHLRSGLKRKHLAELHGNMFVENCDKCRRLVFAFSVVLFLELKSTFKIESH